MIGKPFQLDEGALLDAFWSGYTEQVDYASAIAPTVIPSNKEEETHRWLDLLSMFADWTNLGSIPVASLSKYEYKLKNLDLGRNWLVAKKELERDGQGMINRRATAIGAGLPAKKNEMLAAKMTGADADELLWDNQYFYDTAHPGKTAAGAATTFSNDLGYALTRANLQTTITTMKRYRLQNGQLANVTPTDLVVPPELEYTAREILNSTMTPEDANTATNPMFGGLKLQVFPNLADTTEWYVNDNSKGITPFYWQNEKDLEVVPPSQDTDSYRKSRTLEYSADARGNYGVSLWFLSCKNDG